MVVQDPGRWWRVWQLLKGTDPATLSIPDVDLRGKNVLITGGNNGIGREAALRFASWGANVTLVCRPSPPPHETHPDVATQECRVAADAKGHTTTTIEWWDFDAADLASVAAVAERWLATGRPLDLFANNAGMGGTGVPKVTTKDEFELIHQVNFLSHTLLAFKLLPALAKAREPRMICTTSCMQFLGIFDTSNANAGANAYSNNKLYYQMWLTELQARLAGNETYSHIVVHGIHPGFVGSGIWTKPQTKEAPPEKPNTTWLAWTIQVLLKYYSINSQQGSLAILNAAVTPRKDRALYFSRISPVGPMPYVHDVESRQLVWDMIKQELGSRCEYLV